MKVKAGDHLVAHVNSTCAAIIDASVHGGAGILHSTAKYQWTVQQPGRTTLTFTAPSCQLISPPPSSGCAGGIAVLGDLTVVASAR